MRITLLATLIALLFISCSDDEKSSKVIVVSDSLEDNSENKPFNIILVTAENFNQQVFDLLRKDANAKLIPLFNGYHYYSPESYFDRYADANANYTALFSGKTTIHGHLGIDKDSTHLGSWIDSLKAFGYSRSIITNGHVGQAIYGSAFSTKVGPMPFQEEISLEIVNEQPDFIWAAGRRLFTKRKDRKDLFKQMAALDYHLDFDMNAIDVSPEQKYAGIFFNDNYPDTLKFVENGINTWKKFIVSDERPFFLWLHIQDINKALTSGKTSNIHALNKNLDALLEVQENAKGKTLIVLIDAFQRQNLTINYFKSDSVNVQLSINEFQFTSMPIWTYGLEDLPFGKYIKNTDLGRSIISLAKK